MPQKVRRKPIEVRQDFKLNHCRAEINAVAFRSTG
jgi:hypothetical protein